MEVDAETNEGVPSGRRAADTAENDVPPEPFACVAIIGVGLMGGSLGMALRERGLARHVLGVDRTDAVLTQAVAAGAIDEGSTDLDRIRSADCVVFAVPVGLLPALMGQAAPFIGGITLVTDLGSVKSSIVTAGERLFGERFVGGHPMAGSETSGVEAARPDLFIGAAWALVSSQPDRLAPTATASRLTALVRALGARPVTLDPQTHDHCVALISHLPHLLSFAFARTVAADSDAEPAIGLAGGSYKDLTRVAQSPPQLWGDIFLENHEALAPVLDAFERSLRQLRVAVENRDRTVLEKCLGETPPMA